MAERLNARDSKSCIRGDSYRGFKSLLIRQLKNALNKLGVFLSDESGSNIAAGLFSRGGIRGFIVSPQSLPLSLLNDEKLGIRVKNLTLVSFLPLSRLLIRHFD